MAKAKKHQKKQKTFNPIALTQSLLISIGKPLYWTIEYSFIGLLLLVAGVGKAANLSATFTTTKANALLTSLKNLKPKQKTKSKKVKVQKKAKKVSKKKSFKLPTFPKLSFPKLTLPKITLTLPKVSLPHLPRFPKLPIVTFPTINFSLAKLVAAFKITPGKKKVIKAKGKKIIQEKKKKQFEFTFLNFFKSKKHIGRKKKQPVFFTFNFKKTPLFKRLKKVLTGKKRLLPKVKLSWLSASFIFFIFVAGLSAYIWIFKGLPSPSELTTRKQEVSTKIYDRQGILLYKIYKNKNRTPVNLEQIPTHVQLATLAAEDAEFYSHPGFSIRGITRSLYKNATEGELAGGSTITQQLVKNALLSSEKTILRKVREIVLSIRTEIAFSKNEILEMYLNEVSYGGSAYGIEEASEVYFGKGVADLSLGEAALLAGLPKSPTRYSPFGNNPMAAIQRRKDVLELMVINGYISDEQAESAEKEELKFAENRIDIKAPHFVMYVKEQLIDKYGEEVVEQGGLEVHTTLDYQTQKMAEEVVKTEVDKLARLNVGNGAAVVINPQTGELLAMVGSKNYFDTKHDGQVNVTTRLRQPGSSIKVLNYAYALESGKYTPASILQDTAVTFNTAGTTPYSPKNYDGKFRGAISLRSALAESRNIPAVRLLASYGVDKMIDLGEKMGITTWTNRSRFGLSLTLGGGEVKLVELANLFAVIANEGNKSELLAITKVKNYQGKVIEENGPRKEKVLDSRTAFQLIDILKDNGARSPAFGSNSALVVSGHPEIAVKTGTSNDLRDNLTVGFNQKYLVAVWVGNNSGAPMSRIASGITGAAPIWNKIITNLLASEKSAEWQVPDGLARLPICTLTGTLSCQGCPTRMEWFTTETAPKLACRRETIDKINIEKKKKSQPIGAGQILPEAASIIN